MRSFRGWNSKNFLGRGSQQTPPTFGGGHSLPNPPRATPSASRPVTQKNPVYVLGCWNRKLHVPLRGVGWVGPQASRVYGIIVDQTSSCGTFLHVSYIAWSACVRHTDELSGIGWTDRGAVWKADSCSPQHTTYYTVSQKKQDTKLLAISSPTIIRFSIFCTSRLIGKFAINSTTL